MNGNLCYFGISGTIHNWFIEAKNGRLVAFGLSRDEAKRRTKGTSNRARQY